MTLSKSAFGVVKPFTRHVKACKFKDEKDYNGCKCPKWLYTREKGKKPVRASLTTPSWAEAQRIAADVLRGLDPEIAAARSVNEAIERTRLSVPEACKLWLDRTEREYGPDSGSLVQYRGLTNHMIAWARSHNIEAIQEITTIQLEQWYSLKPWTRYSEATRSQRWGVVRSMFAYFHERGAIASNPIIPIKQAKVSKDHVQGPYTDEQVQKIFAQVKFANPPRYSKQDVEIYRARLFAFITLLLHTGCDVVDAVLFEPVRIENMTLNGAVVPVYRYVRTKTEQLAVIPISSEVARLLRKVPTLPTNPTDMPFRNPEYSVIYDPAFWARRIKVLLKLAGATRVTLPGKDKMGRPRTKKANVKQFRHTFAVQQLRAGQRPEEVAKMLGHADTTMVRKHYAPWVPELDTAHIQMVMQRRTVV